MIQSYHMTTSAFTSDAARTKFLEAYDSAFDRLWPVTRQTISVRTSFGTAAVYRLGRSDGVPVVLVPGAGGNALTWRRYVARLGESHPVVALDPIGEPGASTHDRPIAAGRDIAQALDEVLAELDIERVHLVGNSYGGWTTIQHAIHYPGRVASITLIDPAGLGKLNLRFMLWVIAGGLSGLAPPTVRRRAARWLRNATLLDDDLMALARHLTAFRRRLPAPGVLSDDELRALEAPTLALLGARSQMFDAERAASRIRTTVPNARAEVVAGAGHDLPVSHPDLILDRIAKFVRP
jgi:pimeloyl-ACP methyl ester carboxylesterase